jgi:hypothetical protein
MVSPLPGRFDASAAYDEHTNMLTVFGGCCNPAGQPWRDTWTFDGSNWLEKFPSVLPTARYQAATVYDTKHRKVVVFGGKDGAGNSLGDTWLWDGLVWSEVFPSTSPSPRFGASAVYDSKTEKFVLFGGSSRSGSTLNDTWTWDGATWTQLQPVASPPSRSQASAAYDAANQQIVLFGGADLSGNALGDTWLFDHNTWKMFRGTEPSSRYDAGMGFDAQTGNVVLVGGSPTSNAIDKTWIWNGTAWTEEVQVNRQLEMHGETIVSAPPLGQLLLFGGADPYGGLNTLWQWNGQTWAQLMIGPGAREPAGMVYDPIHETVVLFGGQIRTGPGIGQVVDANDTWLWQNDRWTQIFPLNSPPPRSSTTMVFDEATKTVLLFGGGDPNGNLLNDTWSWDGNDWTELIPSTSPPVRACAAMTYDAARRQVVLFGGYQSYPTPALDDTWLWDGANWTEASPIKTPGGRCGAAMAYDTVTQSTVLAGGANDLNTWLWDGSNWTLAEGKSPAVDRSGAAMVYDDFLGQVVLFGGEGFFCPPPFGPCNYFNDTWFWNGSTWTDVPLETKPSARASAGIAYDQQSDEIVLLGGTLIADYGYAEGTVVSGEGAWVLR